MAEPAPYVHVIWCDDIRQEVGNKPSFMGVYTGGLVLPELPAVMPKLCAWVLLSAPMSKSFEGIGVRIAYDDGTPIVDIPDLSAPAVPPGAARPAATRQNLMFSVALVPLPIPEGCKHLQVVVTWGGEELAGPRLPVEVNPAAVALLNAPPPA